MSGRYRIHKGLTGELWAGGWQVWRGSDLLAVWKTHADCVGWLDEHLGNVRQFVDTGDWRKTPKRISG